MSSSSRKIRSFTGSFIQPTSTNSEDARIPKNGYDTRVLAKNILKGDRFKLSYGGYGEVSSVGHNRRRNGTMSTEIVVNVSSDSSFTRTYTDSSAQWVTIRETPKARRSRRNASRVPTSRRYRTELH